MATSLVDADSLLALDIGSANTRALLFDVVEGRYHLVATGIAPTTFAPPFNNVSLGIREAIEQIQRLTGKALIGKDGSLIIPSASETEGVDQLVLTVSAGGALNTVCVGVLEDVSLQSAIRLAHTTYADIKAKLHIGDKRGIDGRINVIVQAHPDLVIMAGGVNEGATRAVEQMVDAVGLAAYVLPPGHGFEVLYAGNERLARKVEKSLQGLTNVRVARNIRPTLETEQLGPAQEKLLEIYRDVRLRQMPELSDLLASAEGKSAFYPTAYGIGRIVRFLSKIYGGPKGVLAVDLGAEATTVAFAWKGEGQHAVFTDLGLGAALANLYPHTPIEKIERWLPLKIAKADIVDYLYNKLLYPQSIPMTEEDLAVEQALARELLRRAVKRAWESFPAGIRRSFGKFLPYFDPILASGSILTHSASPAQALLTLLDGIQPTGVSTFVLDFNQLLATLGAAAELNPILPVQMMRTYHFLPLATVISPAKTVKRPGIPLLRIEAETHGSKRQMEIKSGRLYRIDLRKGQKARLRLQPLHAADVGFGPGRGGIVAVTGGELGVVIDARGRPILLPSDPNRRRAQLAEWLSSLA